MPRLRQNERDRAVGMLAAGTPVTRVARLFGCSRATIHNLGRRYNQTGDTVDAPRSGRPKATTPRQDRMITLTHLRNRFQPATVTARQFHVSGQTIRNRLRSNRRKIRARRPYKRPILLRRHRDARLQWSRRHLRWRRVDWNNVLFSDEARFNLSRADGRIRVYRRTGERYADCCVIQRDRFGGGSVMVWGGICGGRKTRLLVINGNLNAQRYINEVLVPEVIPFLRQNGPNLNFQQDNARPHVARVVNDFLNQNNVDRLPWPALSPNLSPIEHLWDELSRRIHNGNQQINTVAQLRQALVREWNNLPNALVQRYVNSMRRRIQACIQANGGFTRY